MRKKLFIGVLTLAVFLWNCGENGNPSGGKATLPTTIGGDTLATICVDCPTDSSTTYSFDGNTLVLYSDSSATDTAIAFDVVLNGNTAVLSVDSLVGSTGEVKLIYSLEAGDGSSIENSVWKLDSVNIDADFGTIVLDTSISMASVVYTYLDPATGQVYMSSESAASGDLAQTAINQAILACPLVFLQAVEQSASFPIVSDIDTARSDCDTTWATFLVAPAYITTNEDGELIAYNADTDAEIANVLTALEGFMEMFGGGGISF